MSVSVDIGYWKNLEGTYPNLIDGIAPRTKINVSGRVYEICTGTLDAYPETLLGDSARRERYRLGDRTLYFHRHPSFFVYVLSYYIRGYVQRPVNIPHDVFIEECRFFSIPLDDGGDENRHLLFHVRETPPEDVSLRKPFQWFSFFVTTISCLALLFGDLTTADFLYNQFTSDGEIVYDIRVNHSAWVWIEFGCVTWFMLEFYIRFLSSPTALTVELFIDMICISPVLIFILTHTLARWFPRLCALYPFLICLKSFRVLRLFRCISGFEIIGQALLASIDDLSATLSICCLFIVQSGIVVYLIERTEPRSTIVQPSDGLAWAVDTWTTIGFGEHIPRTGLGRLIAIVACIFGLILLALPIPITFRRFQIIYQSRLKRDLWTAYR